MKICSSKKCYNGMYEWKKGWELMKKNKMLLVLMSGVLTFTAMPSVYASNSYETVTSEKSKTIQNNSSSLSESALNDSE